jgi:hypothetical protein
MPANCKVKLRTKNDADDGRMPTTARASSDLASDRSQTFLVSISPNPLSAKLSNASLSLESGPYSTKLTLPVMSSNKKHF